ncbi:hypothetical protein [Aliagarivorans marinus]|uniref:hypothetical protein n=1 Tax=Aliagarivorans marinus TaxID=561965 RepID=UPI000428B51C|nr:hypothetical protein [Aliagarivorans marinus]
MKIIASVVLALAVIVPATSSYAMGRSGGMPTVACFDKQGNMISPQMKINECQDIRNQS